MNDIPTFKFYAKGVEVPYTGGHKENEILEWIIKQSGNNYSKVECDTLAKRLTEMDKNHEEAKRAHEADGQEYHPHLDHYMSLVHFGTNLDTPMFKAFSQ